MSEAPKRYWIGDDITIPVDIGGINYCTLKGKVVGIKPGGKSGSEYLDIIYDIKFEKNPIGFKTESFQAIWLQPPKK